MPNPRNLDCNRRSLEDMTEQGPDLSEFLANSFTVPTEFRDYGEWHQGRSRYAVWVIDSPCPAVKERFEAARAHLWRYLIRPYRRAPHISIFICGFLSQTANLDDDYPAACMAGHARDLKQSGLTSFDIEIGGIHSFASAPYLAVRDSEGGIAGIRDRLSSRSTEIRFAPYTPHLTLGLYNGAFDTRQIAAEIAVFPDRQPLRWRVEKLHLATYNAFEIAGPLRRESTIALAAG